MKAQPISPMPELEKIETQSKSTPSEDAKKKQEPLEESEIAKKSLNNTTTIPESSHNQQTLENPSVEKGTLSTTPANEGGAAQTPSQSLWAQIAPCWYRLAGSTKTSVTLKISLNEEGGLAIPPEIIRAQNHTLSQDHLKAEYLALTALQECGAYKSVANQKDLMVSFPNPANETGAPIETYIETGGIYY